MKIAEKVFVRKLNRSDKCQCESSALSFQISTFSDFFWNTGKKDKHKFESSSDWDAAPKHKMFLQGKGESLGEM